MHLQGISLQNFRSYAQRTFLFPHRTTVIVAKNAQGKTSIIEAIHLLASGESFRAETVEEMVRFETELGRVKGKVLEEKTGEETELEVVLTRGLLNGKAVQSRLYSVNTVRKRKKDFVGKCVAVAFRPEDMRLVEGSPGRRRDFIDTAISLSDRIYTESLKTYEDALKRRNKLLLQIREGEVPRSVLTYWTSLLLKHGQVIQEKRRQFFASFSGVVFPISFTIQYEPSVISEDRLATYAEKEIAAGHTLVGPHKDDFGVDVLFPDGVARYVSVYGSRGQQRMAVLWLKVCELQYLSSVTGSQPLLLLDDILSELDVDHRHYVLELLRQGQTIMTTIEDTLVEEVKKYVDEVEVIHL